MNNRYARLLQNLHTGIIVHDADMTVSFSNRRAAELLGLPADSIAGRLTVDPTWYFVDEKGRRLVPEENPVNHVIATHQPIRELMLGIHRTDKTEVTWVLISAFPEFASDGRLEQVVVNFHDVSHRKRIENLLLETQQALASTLDAIPDLLFELGKDGRYYDYHSPRTELLAAPPHVLLNKTVAEVLPFEATQVVMAAIDEAHRTGFSHGRQFRLDLPSGEHWFELSVARKGVDAGDASRFIVVSREVTERHRIQAELEASKSRLSSLIQSVEGIVWEADARTFAFTFVSEQAERLFGFPCEDWLAPGFWIEHLHPDDRAWVPDYCASCTKRLEWHDFEYRFIARDGRTVWLHDIVTVVAENGEPRWLRGLMVDVTRRKQDEEALRLAANVFTHAREGIAITAPDTVILDVNEAYCRITGYTRAELIGKTPQMLHSEQQTQALYHDIWQKINDTGYWSGELWNLDKSGKLFATHQTISTVRDADDKIRNYVAIISDITVEYEHRQQLEYAAYHDRLTGLPNRNLLSDRLQQAMIQCNHRQQSMAIAYLDLDGFKTVNDSHGHETGDQLLIALADRMKESLRKGDTLARIGGDEFVAVLGDLENMSDYELILQRLLAAAASPIKVGELTLQVSASMGVTVYPKDKVDVDQLLRHADQAMYAAKQAGKNRYHLFDVALDEWQRNKNVMLMYARNAIERGEFEMYYQPKVNMQTGEVIGAEALIRWHHPERGLLLPGDFLPLIENQPVAMEIGQWTIVSVLAQIAVWQRLGLRFLLSVNIGAYQLQDDNFVNLLAGLLAQYPDVTPALLQLEVLETSALDDIVKVSRTMRDCCALGVSFALDDFGTGYSSLTYLRRLPIEYLKIDQSFVRDMLFDPDDMSIVRGVIGLADSFRRRVIAEGVETVAHGTALLSLGCIYGQGYGIAKPMPASQFLSWIASWKPDATWIGQVPNRQM
ncbi:MAG: EAL domain-containing protein [Nitrosomonas sp.]|nr:MAG: EAL domain-containing protein [Nitrosomonas sp.]